ncbi:hypothetical protein [Vibrio sp. PNB23_22_7]
MKSLLMLPATLLVASTLFVSTSLDASDIEWKSTESGIIYFDKPNDIAVTYDGKDNLIVLIKKQCMAKANQPFNTKLNINTTSLSAIGVCNAAQDMQIYVANRAATEMITELLGMGFAVTVEQKYIAPNNYNAALNK